MDYEDAQIALTNNEAVSECEFHGYLVDESDDSAVAAAKIELAQKFKESPEKIEELVGKVMADAGLECPACAKNEDD